MRVCGSVIFGLLIDSCTDRKTILCADAGTHRARESTEFDIAIVGSSSADSTLPAASSALSAPILTDGWNQIAVPCLKFDGPKADSWYEVSGLVGAGLRILKDKLILFERKQVAELWNDLNSFLTKKGVNEINEKVFSIYGSPGVGKSCEVWAWCLKIARQEQLDVLWVHVDKFAKATCIEKRGNDWNRCRATASELSVILENSQANVLVFDGFECDDHVFCSCLLHLLPEKFPERKVVIVSSLGAGLQPKHLGVDLSEFKQFEMDPWTLEQFLCACKSTAFFNSVIGCFDVDKSSPPPNSEMVETLVKQKFYFAGASARWMFQHTTDEIKGIIRVLLEQVRVSTSLMSFTTGLHSSESNNHLLLKFRDEDGPKTFFVSQCALDFALRRWGSGTDIKYAYSLAEKHKNPAFLGWVVQFDFFDQIKLVASLTDGKNEIPVLSPSETSENWTVTKVIDFDSKATVLNPNDWKVNHWMLPELWNQAGYDAACLVPRKDGELCLKIVQITKAQQHSLDLNAFSTLIQNVSAAIKSEIRGMEVVFLMPRGSTKPSLVLKGAGNLQLVEVGEGPSIWEKMKEDDKVVFRFFKPYCKASA
jgi:hypothetical protein